MKNKKLHFDANLPGLLGEVLNNPTCGILKLPINITKGILAELAQLAIEIDDDRLHVMMLRLGMYDCSATERVEKIKELNRKIENAIPYPKMAVSCRTCKSCAYRYRGMYNDCIVCLKHCPEFKYCYGDDGRSGRCRKWTPSSDFLDRLIDQKTRRATT